MTVEDFGNLDKLRAEYDLRQIKRPVNLAFGANKYPLGRGQAKAEDQKSLTEEEYKNYSRNYLRSIIQ